MLTTGHNREGHVEEQDGTFGHPWPPVFASVRASKSLAFIKHLREGIIREKKIFL